jgi:uncharacterized protein
LTVIVRAGDMADGRPLYHQIVERARSAGLAGANVTRGLQGFGTSARLRSSGLAGLNGTEPVLIEIIDDAARVHEFVPVLDGLIDSGIIVLKSITTAVLSQNITGESATAAT